MKTISRTAPTYMEGVYLIGEPTPEQLADRGQADGIPARTVEHYQRRDRRKFCQHMLRAAKYDRRGQAVPRAIIRCGPDGIKRFPSMSAAAASVAGAYMMAVRRAAEIGKVYQGYHWSFAPAAGSAEGKS